jgi:hypothetical protein
MGISLKIKKTENIYRSKGASPAALPERHCPFAP